MKSKNDPLPAAVVCHECKSENVTVQVRPGSRLVWIVCGTCGYVSVVADAVTVAVQCA